MIRKMRSGLSLIKNRGMGYFLYTLKNRVVTACYERYYDVDTMGCIPLSEFGRPHDPLDHYSAMSYQDIRSVLKKIPLDRSECSFIDYGSGKGRAVLVAAMMGYRKVRGVELFKELYDISAENVGKVRPRTVSDIEVHNVDAMTYVLPDDVNVVFFFNPFKGEVLRRVTGNIADSFNRRNRTIYVVYFNNVYFDEIVGDDPLFEKLWQHEFRTNVNCALYIMGTASDGRAGASVQ